ncbi:MULTISPECIES: GNAT family N-acetyltransferase [unclassified Lysinibacillus]|uniref:GNAT family N-acetyltransferase n=1 Tax=unclassified Lysinibacillus TaxID=2636778 RepID=UPI0025569F1F|nr:MULTISPECIES: GNAT family N-acetyltransferase [unclassified Lysinibacillus]MDM5247120.1 GNAT family N-acetyltransferase [Lysinibacillus sp. G4S2]
MERKSTTRFGEEPFYLLTYSAIGPRIHFDQSFFKTGYMTETVSMMKDWLLRQSNVKYVIADTGKNNIASHKVLQKAGATLYSESEELYFWRFH